MPDADPTPDRIAALPVPLRRAAADIDRPCARVASLRAQPVPGRH